MLAALGRAYAAVRWYLTSMMGDTAYAGYVAHLRRTHPDRPVPSEREFWRARYAEQGASPEGRCC
ncbi:YbdD/YjiX family protein [Mycetocola spongiae]|uniref:YbdD/YjiX family protein n=1 Tax=Mycetocola spongiae TaxID=2859226 RepID=UPI001CF18DD9|nr:YbdD/YjiX family protein [Mycetocola spongiae]UCR88272.1 YbdD/YjiX family protein [Mycetocola spongiae]